MSTILSTMTGEAKWDLFEVVEKLVPPIRIERTTRGLGNRCSIQLSYGGIAKYQ